MIGQNPKASQNQSDDFQDVAALLRSLPQVAAPADFNASLKARIASAKAEANEFADITSLIKDLPRVSAPSDFDFRLRARIAQAKAEQQKTSKGWFAELFGGSFSWPQAGAAMAAVAIIVSVGAFGILHSGNSVKSQDNTVAIKVEATPLVITPNSNTTQTSGTEIKNQEPAQVAVIAPTESHKPKTPHLTGNLTGNTGIRESVMPVEEPENPPVIAARTVIIKHRSGEARMVNLSEYNLGLQTANLRATAPKAAPSKDKDAVFAANIY